MPLQCNIDARGKLVRLVWGIGLVVIGVILIFRWALPSGELVPWLVAVGTILAGAFGIFESRTGWCIVRAMGWKTPV